MRLCARGVATARPKSASRPLPEVMAQACSQRQQIAHVAQGHRVGIQCDAQLSRERRDVPRRTLPHPPPFPLPAVRPGRRADRRGCPLHGSAQRARAAALVVLSHRSHPASVRPPSGRGAGTGRTPGTPDEFTTAIRAAACQRTGRACRAEGALERAHHRRVGRERQRRMAAFARAFHVEHGSNPPCDLRGVRDGLVGRAHRLPTLRRDDRASSAHREVSGSAFLAART